MKKSRLKQIIKEEIAKVLQEETEEKLQGSFNPKEFTSAGLATNLAQKAGQAINKLKGAKGTLDSVKLERDEKEAFSKLFLTLLKVDDASVFNKLIGNIKSFVVKKIDKPTS